jgi:sarcosine oxidase
VVACDAWTNRLLAGLGVALPLTVTREHAVHFAIAPDAVPRHSPGAFGVWIWMDDPSYYGFSCLDGATVKVGQDCGGVTIEPDGDGVGPQVAPDDGYLQQMRGFVAARIPAAGPVARVTTCRYTLTPDRDFVLGPVPGLQRVLLALGAAHGFKFAPWFGRVLADLATERTTPSQIGAFAPDRAALSEPEPAVRWLV